MANYATLKAAIQNVVKTNGNNEITGALLQQSLLTMINSLGADYQFVGVAQPLTNPGTPDQNVFYLAGPGVYPNFGNVKVNTGEIRAFKWNGAWDTTESLTVGNMDGYQFGGVVTPESSVPTSDAKLFFVACTEGEYNFVDEVGDHIEVAEGEVAMFYGQRPLWTKAVVAPHKFLTISTDVPDLGYDEADPHTIAELMGQSIEDVLAKGFVVYNADVTANHYIVVGDYAAEEGGYITFIGRDKVYQYDVNASGYITDEKVTSIAPDNALSENSENAVQNKVVKAAFDAMDEAKQDTLSGGDGILINESTVASNTFGNGTTIGAVRQINPDDEPGFPIATASGEGAVALGSAVASGYRSIAGGTDSEAEGDNSIAMGDASQAQGQSSTAIGDGTLALNVAEVAIGQYNAPSNDSGEETNFTVGIGEGDEHRANALEIRKSGKTYIKGVGGYNGTNPQAGTNDIGTVIANKANIDDLPKNYISKESLTNMLNALKSAGVIRSFTMTWNAKTQTYNFSIS